MIDNIKQILTVGENVAVEFKRCGNGIKADAYESICAFLNQMNSDRVSAKCSSMARPLLVQIRP